MLKNLPLYFKAVAAFFGAAAGATGTALANDNVITQAEWIGIAGAGLLTAVAVFSAKNKDVNADV